ncbi:hypothetical protein KDL01_25310 [Actinospica durhamensis]|uniref:Uncharacterized protein n=1 Tax=Actinospica durhamensis TaxID=1508375 RepID=A0A941ITY7_9ACTN|nr:hypothetical protein [Actinospica durhamensis]MBR7836623.1 hypothetical protein [Actinospica durhamensis]
MSPLVPLALATRYVAHAVAATGCALLGAGMVLLGVFLLTLVWGRHEDVRDAPPSPRPDGAPVRRVLLRMRGRSR